MNTQTTPNPQFLVRLRATNDRNGNPRRCYLAYNSDGCLIGVWDEGYKGAGCLPEEIKGLALIAPTFDVTPSQYRDALQEV